MTKGIYKFHLDCGRMGDLEGVFIADPIHVEQALASDEEIYYGECLGKHSEISEKLTPDQIKLVTLDIEFIEKFEQLELYSGFDPIALFLEQEEERA